MIHLFGFLFTAFIASNSYASPEIKFKLPIAEEEAVRADFDLILSKARLTSTPMTFTVSQKSAAKNLSTITCKLSENEEEGSLEVVSLNIDISAQPEEWSATFYHALLKMGFLFPHPRMQISPKQEDLIQHCDQIYEWKPRLKYRGFHFHTMHPSEWVEAFVVGNEKIGIETIRWLARNGQNIYQFAMLRGKVSHYKEILKKPYALAKSLGVARGLSAGFAFHQQKSFKFISLFRSLTGIGDKKALRKGIDEFLKELDFDFLTLELGTTEFTSVNFKRTIDWMNQASNHLWDNGKQLFIKVHISSNQKSEEYGNFNFLPQYADQKVGVLPHTVFFYGLEDEEAPMYENGNFVEMANFMLQERDQRPTWFYPETSYYIGMDIDVPLMLTPYLDTRSRDTTFLDDNGVNGQINFTTGQELGYWLIDWTYCLLNNQDFVDDPMIGLRLLGEDVEVWDRIFAYQDHFFKERQVIQMISASNFQDEIPFLSRIHERNLMKELDKDKELNSRELEILSEAVEKIPSVNGIKNKELKTLMSITFDRVKHAHFLRRAMVYEKKRNRNRRAELEKAKAVRLEAQEKMNLIVKDFNRYPEVKIFEKWKNPTSYDFGYGETAATLHFWEREESMIRKKKYSPFYKTRIGMLLQIIF